MTDSRPRPDRNPDAELDLTVEPTGDVILRESPSADAPAVRFTREEWDAFVAGVRQGEFRFD